MKTSVYFVLWIIIYPILGLFHNPTIDNNAFIFALMAVLVLSSLIKTMMPYTIAYEQMLTNADILEKVYNGDVKSFKEIVRRDAIIETATAAYFALTVILIAIFIAHGEPGQWIALVVFVFLLITTIYGAVNRLKANRQLNNDPTPERCVEIVRSSYGLDYTSFYEQHLGRTITDMLAARPRFYSVYLVSSLVLAAICAILGALIIVGAVYIQLTDNGIEISTISGMLFLYGALAVNFGVRDFLDCRRSLKHRRSAII